jgi:hypothetical protein
MHPPVQCSGALLATGARLDSHGIGDAFDCIAQADFFLDEESRKSNAMRLTFGLRLAIPVCFFLHDAFLAL